MKITDTSPGDQYVNCVDVWGIRASSACFAWQSLHWSAWDPITYNWWMFPLNNTRFKISTFKTIPTILKVKHNIAYNTVIPRIQHRSKFARTTGTLLIFLNLSDTRVLVYQVFFSCADRKLFKANLNPPGIHRSPVFLPTKASDAELWCFLWSFRLNKRLSNQSIRRWLETPSRSLWRHYNALIILSSADPDNGRSTLYGFVTTLQGVIGGNR